MKQIKISNYNYTYPGNQYPTFEQLNITIDHTWKAAIIGDNGCGKTTLLKILDGSLEGTGSYKREVSFDYFPYQADGQITVNQLREQKAINSEDWELQVELSKLGIDRYLNDYRLDQLSPGEKAKVKLAILFLNQSKMVLIDEPTNHLDIVGRAEVANYLQGQKGVVVVSHDVDFLDQIVDHVIEIANRKAKVTNSSVSSYLEDKANVEQMKIDRELKLKNEINRLEHSARQVNDWSHKSEAAIKDKKISEGKIDRGFLSHKAAKVMKRSQAIEKRIDRNIEEKRGLLSDIRQVEDIKISTDSVQQQLVSCYGLQLLFPGFKTRPLSFTIGNHHRLWIKGPNGIGKTTLLRAIAGEAINYTGQLTVNKQAAISYVKQELIGSEQTLLEYQVDNQPLLLAMLRKFGFARTCFKQPINSLSAGQRRKIQLAISICSNSSLLIWDEPFNYLDISSKQQIIKAIVKHKPTIIFIEHDVYCGQQIATEQLLINRN